MKKNRIGGIAVALIIIACVCLSFFGTQLFLKHYAVVGVRYYPKDTQVLDLRGEEVSPQQYIRLSRDLPDTPILWNVALTEKTVANTLEELTINSLDVKDISAISCMRNLQVVHAENCRDYSALAKLKKSLPDVQVLYFVPVGNTVCDQDTERVEVPDLDEEQISLLACLPNLNRVDATGCTDFDLIRRLQEERPEWNVTYRVVMGSSELSPALTSARVENATYAEIVAGIPGMDALEKLTLANPNASVEELLELREDFPEIAIHWESNFAGVTVKDDAVELDLSGIPLTSVEEAEAAANLCPDLQLLDLSDCGIDNETMAAFRERHRQDYKVVWTIHFSKKCKLRTDEKAFMPLKQGEYYFQESYTPNLKYCEELETIDLGHHKFRSVDWARYMPHLKWLILAHTEVQYIDALASCKELIYLELDFSTVRDLSPLVECTALEDLNVGNTINSPKLDPLLQMPWLKHLWVEGRSGLNVAAMQEALPDTIICTSSRTADGLGWRKLPNYFKQRDNLGMYYMR